MTEEQAQYHEKFVGGLQLMWGKGFLAPGGADEIGRILESLDLADNEVLEIGSGLGGPACCLVENFGARQVVGIDIEPMNLPRATKTAEERGLSSRIEFQVADACALPCDEASFDVVFGGGGVFCEVKDKRATLREAYRVLRPGGWFAINDWFHGGEPFSAEFRQWVGGEAMLDFEMTTVAELESDVQQVGFEDIRIRDRNGWYRDESRREVQRMAGEDRDRFEALLGEKETEQWIEATNLKATAVAKGDLRPHHLRGRRPQ